jgi:hypothetical protein
MTEADCRITVAMSQRTIDALHAKGLTLYGFKAVQTTARAMPLIWFKSSAYKDTLVLAWTERYQAYLSNSVIITGRPVMVRNVYPAVLGDTLTVTYLNRMSAVTATAGMQDAITIENEVPIEITGGILQMPPGGSATPICALPLFSGTAEAVTPIEQVLLMFSTARLSPGTVMEQCCGSGLMLDLTASNSRTVCFDIDGGWSWGRGIWARTVPPNSNLVPLLVQSPPGLLRRRAAMLRSKNY